MVRTHTERRAGMKQQLPERDVPEVKAQRLGMD